MTINWSTVFDTFGTKVVTKTDKEKAAYVPNAPQLAAIAAAGIKPSDQRPANPFSVTILDDPHTRSVSASFYHALRETDPGRPPEPRMGRAFISSWLNVGDTVAIGNIGRELFATRVKPGLSEEALVQEVARKAHTDTVLALAAKAKGRPARRKVERDDFVRNPFVVAGAIIRSKGVCEMPGCRRELFEKVDGSPYLEVHHVVPLGEGGDDTLVNAAALCPHCHRELHFGSNRLSLRRILSTYVSSLRRP